MNRWWPGLLLVVCAACGGGGDVPPVEPGAHAAADEGAQAAVSAAASCTFRRPGFEEAPPTSKTPVCAYHFLVNGTEFRRVDSTWDSAGRLLTERSCTDRCTDRSWGYDAQGRLVRSAFRFSGAELAHSYVWAANGLERRVREVRGDAVSVAHPRVSADCSAVTWSFGTPSAAVPAMPVRRVERFDDLHRLVKVELTATDPTFNSTTELRYHANGRLGEKHVVDLHSESRQRWDDRGNAILEQLEVATGDSERTERTFDDQDRLLTVRTEARDLAGHVDYGKTTFEYQGPLVVTERRETWTTDATIPPLLVVLAHQYDGQGRRLSSTEDVGGDGVVEGTATYTYDDAGRLTTTVWKRPQGATEERLEYCGP